MAQKADFGMDLAYSEGNRVKIHDYELRNYRAAPAKKDFGGG